MIVGNALKHILDETMPTNLKKQLGNRAWFIAYIDDMTIVAPNRSICADLLQHVLHQFELLGLIINTKKTQQPTQTPKILGYLYDIRSCSISIPKDKADDISSTMKSYINLKVVKRFQLETLAGKLAFLAPALRPGFAVVRSSVSFV